MQIELKKMNEIFANLDEYHLDKKYSKLAEEQDKNYYSEKSQGEEGSRFVVYDVSLPDVYLKVEYRSDSYGEDKGVASIQFVTAATKTVQEFKAIN